MIKYKASNINSISFNLRMVKDCALHREILSKVQGEEKYPSKHHEVELEHYRSSGTGSKDVTIAFFTFSGVLDSVDTSEIPAFREPYPDEVILTLNYHVLGPIQVSKQPGAKR